MRKVLNKILIVTSYKLAYDQMKELEQLDYDYIYMADELKRKWENISKTYDIKDICDEIISFAKEKGCTELLVMGYTPAVVYLVSKFGLDKCYYSRTNEFPENVKNLDGTISEIQVIRHIGFYDYLTNRRKMPSELLF